MEIELPMTFHVEPILDDPTVMAFLYGPVVLVGLANQTHTFYVNLQNIEACFSPIEGKSGMYIDW